MRPARPRRPPARAAGALLLLGTASLAAVGCTTKTVESSPSATTSEMGSMAPMLSVERFLQAVNARDFEAMRRLFGTHEGPIVGDPQQVEIRMSAIADILRHDDYRIVGQSREPGRVHPTTRVAVTLTLGRRVVPEVPFLVVRAEDGRWLVEQIDLEKVTRS